MASFLSKLFGRKTAAPPRLCLAAFGKHPGWDDHLEIGIETELLATVKQVLYVEGIGGCIESGAWEKLQPDQRLESLRHAFLWRRGRYLAVGRLWASRDGKGRARYPMVCCADCTGIPLEWVAEHVSPALERIEKACVQTQSPDAVHAILATEGDQLRQSLNGPASGFQCEMVEAAVDVIPYLATLPEMGSDRQKLLSVLYLMDTETGAFQDARSIRSPVMDHRPLQLRVPPCAKTPAAVAVLWTRFLLALVSDDAPILILQPLQPPVDPWVDLILGEPTSSQCFCMCATPTAIPLTTDIPYDLPREFVRRAREMIGPPAKVEGREGA